MLKIASHCAASRTVSPDWAPLHHRYVVSVIRCVRRRTTGSIQKHHHPTPVTVTDRFNNASARKGILGLQWIIQPGEENSERSGGFKTKKGKACLVSEHICMQIKKDIWKTIHARTHPRSFFFFFFFVSFQRVMSFTGCHPGGQRNAARLSTLS